MREVIIILCAVVPVSTDTVAAEPCAPPVRVAFEAPAPAVEQPIEIIETTGEMVS